MDAARLKESWNAVAQHGDQVPLHFYATLFLMYPETRQLFPVSLAAQRDRLVGALGQIVSDVDNLDALVPFLQHLGRDHRKFQVVTDHYPAVGAALLATLAHFLGPRWTDELARSWAEAYDVIASVMTGAAEDASRTEPPWWDAEVVSRELRTFDVAVLTIRPSHHYPYRPGQSVAVETPVRPRLWRYYSPANSPRVDNTLELHVRQVPGGLVSSALVQLVQVGDVLRLGAPVGARLTLDASQGRDLLLIAGGTGLAPLRALIEQVAAEGGRRRAVLVLGARTARELYDMRAVLELRDRLPWLTVLPVLSDDPLRGGPQAIAVDAARRFEPWHEYEVYACGSAEMVHGTVKSVVDAGVAPDRIHYEEFQSHQYPPAVIGAANVREHA
ncbi:MAG: hypothetical protein HYR62_03070 [Actinobacteria bacterium]|nr:hypothetical protein [Actinomycetota bacterium]MBI3686117.1 hypothetical protein [Actinomycetota bacterium]